MLSEIIHGNCLEVMRELDDNSIDLVLTDPPYGITACKWDAVVDLEKMWAELKRIGKPNCAFVFTASQPFTTDLINSNRKWFKYEWIWAKNYASGALLAKKMPMKSHENVIVFYTKQPTYNRQMVRRTEQELKRLSKNSVTSTDKHTYVGRQLSWRQCRDKLKFKNPFSVLQIKSVFNRSSEKVAHPTQKPIALMEYLIRTYSNEGDLILDPFAGSGTTGVAAKMLKRDFVGIELSAEYCKIAERRIATTMETL